MIFYICSGILRDISLLNMDQVVDPPQVDVICWDAQSVYVRCPYCEETHCHGFSSYASQRRLSHCWPGQSYQFTLPIVERTQRVAYEIDKSKARFVNVCTLEELEQDLDEEDQLANQFSATAISNSSSTRPGSDENMYEAAQEAVTVDFGEGQTFEQKAIDFAVSDCVTGRLGAVQKFLDTSPDAAIFLRGRDYDGDTTVIMASCEKNSDMVSLLLDRGADVNAVNTKGRSALMEAVF
jgi:Ankyrin repeat